MASSDEQPPAPKPSRESKPSKIPASVAAYNPDEPIGPENPVPEMRAGRRVLQELGIPEANDGGPFDPWRRIRRTAWKPGQSGNLSGRPKGSLALGTAIKRIAALSARDLHFARTAAIALGIPEDALEDLTVGDIIAASAFYHALSGSAPHLGKILDRHDGKVAQTITITSAEENAAKVRQVLAAITSADGSDEDSDDPDDDSEDRE